MLLTTAAVGREAMAGGEVRGGGDDRVCGGGGLRWSLSEGEARTGWP